jgi:hypothetical protein
MSFDLNEQNFARFFYEQQILFLRRQSDLATFFFIFFNNLIDVFMSIFFITDLDIPKDEFVKHTYIC